MDETTTKLFAKIDLTTKGALLSDDRAYRYLLWRPVKRPALPLLDDQGPKVALWVMLNPSSADEVKPDRTVDRCVSFAGQWGCTAILVVNLFAIRSKNPATILAVPDPVGPSNDWILQAILQLPELDPVVVAWGVDGCLVPGRIEQVVAMLGDRQLLALGTTKEGHPRHPLYLSRSTDLVPWSTSSMVDRRTARKRPARHIQTTAPSPR